MILEEWHCFTYNNDLRAVIPLQEYLFSFPYLILWDTTIRSFHAKFTHLSGQHRRTLIKKISCSLACKPYPPKLTKHYWSIALFLSFGFLFSMISFHVEDETNHFTISALSMLLQGKVFDMDQLVCGTSASHKTTNKKLKQFLWRMYICFCTLLIHGACIRCLFLSFFWVYFM
jgi:hypothetical protein